MNAIEKVTRNSVLLSSRTNWLTQSFGRSVLFVTALLGASLQIVVADEFDEIPGLVCVISDGSHTVSRIDRRLCFEWSDSEIDSRITTAQSVTWTGNLIVHTPGRHTFHVQLAGSVSVAIDDRSVLQEEEANTFVSSSPVELSAGDHQIRVEFKPGSRQPANDSRDPKLQLFWSSPDFTLEPLPANCLWHSPEESDDAVAQQGRQLVDALRCAACHTGLEELPVLKAPNLHRIYGHTDEASIVRRLTTPESVGVWSSMPTFGFTDVEANDVAAFLLHSSAASGKLDDANRKAKPKSAEVKFKSTDADTGQKIVLMRGCVACHAISDLPAGFEPQATPWHGPDLTDVGKRRDSAWLMEWLATPKSINADRRMPLFSLTDDERRQIVAALTKSGETGQAAAHNETARDQAAVARGRELVIRANCASCHAIPGIETAKAERVRPTTSPTSDTAHNCLAEARGDTKSQAAERLPRYRLNENQRKQIHAWLASLNSNLPTAHEFARGELLLHRNGCLACHDRDQQLGLSAIAASLESKRDDLRGQSQAMIPPPLTAVGDRLRDEYLTQAVAGEQKESRLPWLLVRMPHFEFSPEDRASLVRYFVGSDRIPESADVARPELFEHLDPQHPSLATPSELLIGNQLVGAGGFNCIACHKAGPFEPRNVAMGTRGSDIMTMGQRVRSRYFMRWMQNPIRVVPGIEMPAIRKPVGGVLEDSLSQQISVLWKALADPGFSPPTVVSRYEQFVTLAPGDRPRVIRDVFTIGSEQDRLSVARAFAVGFDNGHNLLLDLDSMQLRQWTIGEFARQRTEGKSWYWDMAGVPLLQSNDDRPFAILVNTTKADAPVLHPVIDERRQAELLSYSIGDDAVSLRVRLRFDPTTPSGKPSRELPTHSAITAWNDPERPLVPVVLGLTLKSLRADGGQTGWTWTTAIEDCPPGYAVQLPTWTDQKSRGEIPWAVSVLSNDSDAKTPLQLESGHSGTLQFQSDVSPTILSPLKVPKLISTSDAITAVPGFQGRWLPIDMAIMPTGMAWLLDGRMVMTSLKGDVWILSDTDQDSLPDSMQLFADGLSAPYGIRVDGDSILVAHKPEVLRLRDSDGDGRADQFDVVASGWGLSDDYHDWTTALVRDRNGELYVGLGSDYSQSKRPIDNDRWRGTVLKIDSTGAISPISYGFRFPMGLAFDRDQDLFVTDNQGVQNTFNEINQVLVGKHYGVPSRHDTTKDVQPEIPAVMVPHPWTRSVNSILFLPDDFANPDLAGHGIGCEYDTRCLIRFTIQNVDGTLQGASYRFSLPDQPGGGGNFVGPVSSAIGPDGALYIGSIWDSGWQGGTNTGSIERIVPNDTLPNGIREIQATPEGFKVTFFAAVDPTELKNADAWSIQGYTRHWSGSYATPDSDRYTLVPTEVTISDDLKTVVLKVQPLKAGFVYEIAVNESIAAKQKLWPAEGYYSMKAVPGR
ncbi:MAG TPA: c-type cytochrome [Planctomycetaceae bacterium]|nr:c-type cytochrome [Planctomycetaceae bacterium]